MKKSELLASGTSQLNVEKLQAFVDELETLAGGGVASKLCPAQSFRALARRATRNFALDKVKAR